MIYSAIPQRKCALNKQINLHDLFNQYSAEKRDAALYWRSIIHWLIAYLEWCEFNDVVCLTFINFECLLYFRTHSNVIRWRCLFYVFMRFNAACRHFRWIFAKSIWLLQYTTQNFDFSYWTNRFSCTSRMFIYLKYVLCLKVQNCVNSFLRVCNFTSSH